MLGFRGCRLGIRYPEITAMQARAIFEAAALAKRQGIKANPEIMIPLVGFKRELDLQTALVHEVAAKVQAEVSAAYEEAERALEMMRHEGETEELAAE